MADAQARVRKAPANPTLVVREAEKTRADLLAEIAQLPPWAFVKAVHAAAYIGVTPGVLSAWRGMRRGPRFHGANEFIRYKIADLDLWMATRSGEIIPDDPASDTPPHRDAATTTT